jgi:hypothetical protein
MFRQRISFTVKAIVATAPGLQHMLYGNNEPYPAAVLSGAADKAFLKCI